MEHRRDALHGPGGFDTRVRVLVRLTPIPIPTVDLLLTVAGIKTS